MKKDSKAKKAFLWVKRYLISANLEESEYKKLQDKIEASNRRNLRLFLGITLTALLVMLIMGSFNRVARNNFSAYLLPAIVMLFIYILSKSGIPTVLPLVYIFSGVLMLFGILLGTAANPQMPASSYVALVVMVPLLFTDRPIRTALLIILSDLVFVLCVFCFKDPSVRSNDMINACMFGAISIIVSSYMMRIKVWEFKSQETISRLATTDIMTGLRNRNSFEENIRFINYSNASSVYCVYVDVNGLHELNNTKGHEAGDHMLIFVGKTMDKIFDHATVYRMGGDEFLAYGMDTLEEEVQNKIDLFQKEVEEAGYSVAVGMEFTTESIFIVEKMVENAEVKMREEKNRYYAMKEKNRGIRG